MVVTLASVTSGETRAESGPGARFGVVRILVVDDEVELSEAVARGLRREGYAVDLAHDGLEALSTAELTPYDLICLDLTMPGMDGLEVVHSCARTAGGEPPRILMLTARDSIDERIEGLDHGADDYLIKPFAFGNSPPGCASLMPRERRAPRRYSGRDIELDDATKRAKRGARELDLTSKEFALLRYFMAHVDQVLSQEHLLEHVWDEHADPFTNTVRVTVGTLRRKLSEDDETQAIETVIGSGYRLVDPGAEADG